ncbi:global response regulator [Salmonella enterica subsp. arizonae]|uniref:Global response regulator n=1 Tax=Salmonella enterica subsp. arizonae TaxID=59203 RepID=A0A379THQ5_SALER|nr:global response regulator [Salmonella enterica subsp. arizonae]
MTIRARNLLSRTMNLGTVSEERRSVESYKFNGWELDINSRSLIGPDGEQYKLPRSEFRAMLHFCEKPRQDSVARRAAEENDRARVEAA